MEFCSMNAAFVYSKALIHDRKVVCLAVHEDMVSLTHAKAAVLCSKCFHAVDNIPKP